MGSMGTTLKKVCAVRSYKCVDTPSLSVCSYLVCFVECLLQESADLVGSGALLHLLLVLTKEQLSIHVLCVGGGGGGGEGKGLDERGNMDAHRYTLMAVEGSTHLVGVEWDWETRLSLKYNATLVSERRPLQDTRNFLTTDTYVAT